MHIQTHNIPTQKQRWFKYGLNVGVLLLALLIALGIANYLLYKHYVRLDFTHNRLYTLSPQTRAVLARIDTPVTLTTLYAAQSEHSEKLSKVDNLLAEYKRRGSSISVNHIDPTTDIAAFEKFIQALTLRFEKAIATRREAIDQAIAAVDSIDAFIKAEALRLPQLQQLLVESQPQAATLIGQWSGIEQRLGEALGDVRKSLARIGAEPLLDIEPAQTLLTLQADLPGFARNLATITDRFGLLLEIESTPNTVKDLLLGMRKDYRELERQVIGAMNSIQSIGFDEYDQVRSRLQTHNCVAVMVGNDAPADAHDSNPGVEALTLGDLYPGFMTTSELAEQRRPEQAYKGEEAVTGALIKLTLRHKTRVILVNPSPMSVLFSRNPNESYQTVAGRLEAMNIRVEEWQPAGGQQFGRPTPPTPKPAAAEGETLVFVSLPPPPPNPNMPFNPAVPPAQEAIVEEIHARRPVLVLSAPVPQVGLGVENNPILDALKAFGLTVEPEQLILRPAPGGDEGAMNNIEFSPLGSHVLGRSIQGLPGMLLGAHPIKIEKAEGVSVSPLLTTGIDTWTDRMPGDRDGLRTLKRSPTKPSGPFTTAAAIEKDTHRMVVVADPYWAMDFVAAAGQFVPASQSELQYFSYFPANPELFVNAICWLAGLDDLIAPGARTQDTRRVGVVGQATLSVIRWSLLGFLPLLCLAAGGFVWFIRRR